MKIAIIGTMAGSILGFRGPLLAKLVSEGHNVYAFAIDYTPEQKARLVAMGVKPVDYQLSRSGLNPIADIKMMFSLKREFRRLQPDVVFSYFVKPVIYGSLAARLAGVPHRVAMLEGLGFPFTQQPNGIAFKTKLIQKVQLFLYHLAFPSTNHLVFLNPDDRDELLVKNRLKANQVSVLGGIGLDLDEFPYQKPKLDTIRFLFIGRLLREKGIFEFLEAADQVKKVYPEAEFVVLGSTDTTSPNALPRAMLDDYISREVVKYPGQVSNVPDWIAQSSVFVLPSYREGVPRSSQEAMAIGRPIITSDVPGCRETVVEAQNGFFVPAFDSSAVAEKMIWFIEHPEQIEPMGLASRKMAEEKFDVHKVNAQMLEIMGLG